MLNKYYIDIVYLVYLGNVKWWVILVDVEVVDSKGVIYRGLFFVVLRVVKVVVLVVEKYDWMIVD